MKDSPRDRFPAYVPMPYRLFLQARKAYRQSMTRWQERAAARGPADPLLEDGVLVSDRMRADASNPPGAISKCARWLEEDLARPEVKAVADRIEALMAEMTRRGLRYTNTAGNFLPREYLPRYHRGKLWENAWVMAHADVRPGQRVLDIGGASTIFSFYLASLGCRVVVVDNDWANCGTLFNARHVARVMGWDLTALDRDIQRPLPFSRGAFDRVFSICVLEHLPSGLRQYAMKEISRVLAPGGIAGFTTDYDATRPVLVTDRGLRFGYQEKFERDVLRPSGLDVYGPASWVDACEPVSFLGAFFLHQPAAAPNGQGT